MRKINKNRMLTSNSGATLIEFAVMFPILILIILGVLEFGLFFFRSQFVHRTVATAANSIQADIQAGSFDVASIRETAYGSGTGVVDYNGAGNYICAASFATLDEAKAANCNSSVPWQVGHPTGSSGAYYVKLTGHVKQTPLTPLMDKFIPDITISSIFRVGNKNNQQGSGWTKLPPAGGALNYDTIFYEVKKSPSEMCKEAGYSGASGACRGTSNGKPYEGSIMYNTWGQGAGKGSFACKIGEGDGGNSTQAGRDTEIMCIK